jgi:hypothetical protein
MSEQKTTPTTRSVDEFIAEVPDERRRRDTAEAVALARRITGVAPRMWGPSIIGFGAWHYRYASGREGDAAIVGLAPRKGALVLYGLTDPDGSAALLERLGPHTTGASCLYLRDLGAVDRDVLAELVRLAWTAEYDRDGEEWTADRS